MDLLQKQKMLEEYKNSLVGKTIDELKEIEQEIVKEADELDKEIQQTEFDLPNKGYKEVAECIRMLLDKQTVNWQYALSYLAMYDFWDPTKNPKKVVYPMLDGTLRVFGQMQFTGYTEWSAVVVINKYFDPLKEEYSNVTEKVYDLASKHNVVMEALGLNEPIGEVQTQQ